MGNQPTKLFPAPTIGNRRNGKRMYAILITKFLSRLSGNRPTKAPDFGNDTFRQFSIRIVIAAHISATAFFNHVFHIIRMRSKPQVFRIYTWRIVARMANTKSILNWPIMHIVGNYVSSDHFGLPSNTTNSNAAISCGIAGPSPFPAFAIGFFVYLFPKTIWKRFGYYQAIKVDSRFEHASIVYERIQFSN